MCSWSYLLLKTTVDYVMKKHINNNCHVLSFSEALKNTPSGAILW
jgi:hypothetical protein